MVVNSYYSHMISIITTSLLLKKKRRRAINRKKELIYSEGIDCIERLFVSHNTLLQAITLPPLTSHEYNLIQYNDSFFLICFLFVFIIFMQVLLNFVFFVFLSCVPIPFLLPYWSSAIPPPLCCNMLFNGRRVPHLFFQCDNSRTRNKQSLLVTDYYYLLWLDWLVLFSFISLISPTKHTRFTCFSLLPHEYFSVSRLWSLLV